MPVLDGFDAARAERRRHVDPLSFVLGGETFTCIPAPTLADTFDLADAPEPDLANLTELGQVRALVGFIDRLLVDTDRARFADLLARRADPIDPLDVVHLGAQLAEAYAGRPTQPSSASGGGRRRTGRRSSSKPSKKASETSAA